MNWFAIRTEPQREFALAGRHDKEGKWIAGILERKGYTVFLPTERRVKRNIKGGRGKRRIEAVYPMFPGYVFVLGNFSWLHLMAETHVVGVVGFDGTPAPISEAAMLKLKAMAGAMVPNRKSVNTRRSFIAGDMAEISCGPFTGQIVKIESIRGAKAKVLIDLFGTQQEASVLLQNLEAA